MEMQEKFRVDSSIQLGMILGCVPATCACEEIQRWVEGCVKVLAMEETGRSF
jgi:hypothetical protein